MEAADILIILDWFALKQSYWGQSGRGWCPVQSQRSKQLTDCLCVCVCGCPPCLKHDTSTHTDTHTLTDIALVLTWCQSAIQPVCELQEWGHRCCVRLMVWAPLTRLTYPGHKKASGQNHTKSALYLAEGFCHWSFCSCVAVAVWKPVISWFWGAAECRGLWSVSVKNSCCGMEAALIFTGGSWVICTWSAVLVTHSWCYFVSRCHWHLLVHPLPLATVSFALSLSLPLTLPLSAVWQLLCRLVVTPTGTFKDLMKIEAWTEMEAEVRATCDFLLLVMHGSEV